MISYAFKNVYIVSVRNVEGQIHSGHTVILNGPFQRSVIYSYETSITVRSHIMKQNNDFQEGISQA